MIIYNITMKVDWSIEKEWLQWMKQNHIPSVLQTGCFERHQFVQLLQIDETDGPTYAVQFCALSLGKHNEYLRLYATPHSKLIRELWGEKYIDFSTLMQEVT